MAYKVISLSFHSDKVQKIFYSGDIIEDDVLHEGAAEKAIEGGFLIPYTPGDEGNHTHIITQEDLEMFPLLISKGIKVGDIVREGVDTIFSDEEREEMRLAAEKAFTSNHTEEPAGGSSTSTEESTVVKHIVTQEDLDINPELVEQGVKVGDEIDLGPDANLSQEEVDAATKEAEAALATAAKKGKSKKA